MTRYDSKFERRLVQGVLKTATYHPDRITYTCPPSTHRYQPDFVYKHYVIEAKGRFRPGEQKKYFHIRQSCAEKGQTFIFLFQNPNTPMPGAKKRANGTKLTMREWAEKNNFLWYTESTISEIL